MSLSLKRDLVMKKSKKRQNLVKFSYFRYGLLLEDEHIYSVISSVIFMAMIESIGQRDLITWDININLINKHNKLFAPVNSFSVH